MLVPIFSSLLEAVYYIKNLMNSHLGKTTAQKSLNLTLMFRESCGLLSGFGIVTIGTFYVHGIEAFPKVPLTESQKNLKL